ncbi:MAG TPA: SMI1/KNR4 family protein [Candidatus Limnocylindrales bacterium]
MDFTPLANLLSGSQVAVLQAFCHRGGMSLHLFDSSGQSTRGGSFQVFQLLVPLEAALRPAGETRPMTIQLRHNGSGRYELSHTFELASIPARVILDPRFRLPNHPPPGMPAPQGIPVTDRATDPEVLAAVGRLVPELTRGYSEERILAAETELGVRLPEDLRALYRLAGDTHEEQWLLGAFDLLPLDALERGAIVADDRVFAINPVVYEAYPAGHVKRVSSNDWWITFAGDHAGNNLAADLDPAPAGRIGQLIEHGRDVHGPVGYVAGSVTELLLTAARDKRAGHAPHPPYSEAHAVGDRPAASLVAEFTDPLAPQELFLNDAGPLDLAELAPLRNLRLVSVNRAPSVALTMPHDLPLESLSIDAGSTDLAPLAGHPTLWHLTLRRVTEPVSILPLQSLSRLIYLDLSGATVTDLETVASLEGLRVLALNPGQWRRLGTIPESLAAAELSGFAELGEALDWAARIRAGH